MVQMGAWKKLKHEWKYLPGKGYRRVVNILKIDLGAENGMHKKIHLP